MKAFQKVVKTKSSLRSFIVEISKLSEAIVNDACVKGAVWIQYKSKGKILRIRNPDHELTESDKISFYYDAKVLSLPAVSNIKSLYSSKHYSVWEKPAGVLSQGTQTGDHASMLRYAELTLGREVYLIHRLDRETAGVMIIGHTQQAASKLSGMFLRHEIQKMYQAIVVGELEAGLEKTLDYSLDGKNALSFIKVLESRNGFSLLSIKLKTGRFHQIRRHLDQFGYPIWGDPKYGKNNKNREGLKLISCSLSLIDPWLNKPFQWDIQQKLSLPY